MKSRRRNEIEEFKLLHVVCCGIIARYSDRIVDKIVYKAKARELIEVFLSEDVGASANIGDDDTDVIAGNH
ncbi:hypothetical protein HDU76_000760 [Blyttiomyces sp. JEL0837]|nr:hypothetical protein HDU76_000760 [Blyttiomyces sp. JEL0837]